MNYCPKCSGSFIHGPYYEKEGRIERLRYRCGRCGYEATMPTHDSERPAPPEATK